jgi:GT2 family glycosyltransferase
MTLADVSVVVPTIGRPRLLEGLLASLAACDPGPAEVLVVDQSAERLSRAPIARFPALGARLVSCDGSGAARARNVGFRQASHEFILCTDDDCTVAPDWIGRAVQGMQARPGAIVTGRVIPAGNPDRVPSTKQDLAPRDYTGDRAFDVLYSGNMAAPRSLVLALGGFDEQLSPADDNDLCYRWLRAGRSLLYDPSLVVWHHDWRTASALDQLAVDYARGQGAFYGKHVRRGDLRMLAFTVRDLVEGLRGTAAAWSRRRGDGLDLRCGILRGLPRGFVAGLRLDSSSWRIGG